jgi:diaminohydroxyphosphoribosylaminopyrimidine deaminase/5-amino-6-(5-phosphoribosylamino)uracil reductase
MKQNHEHFMRHALALAGRGEGRVHPNPLVGAVLVKNGRILSVGAHEFFGGPHAEVRALERYKKVPSGSTLYVTLEPCDHFGKTPPCTDLLLQKGVRRVVAAMKDPDPRMAGRGLARLKKAGVSVRAGVLESDAKVLNRHYLHWISTQKPYVTLKIGQSLDGKIATKSGRSRWITGEASRRRAQEIRRTADAILVGVNTVLADDPLLSVRLGGPKVRPLKVVLDAELRTPPDAKIFSANSPGKTILFTSQRSSPGRRKILGKKAELIVVPESHRGALDWKPVLAVLGKKGVTHLLVEGGGEVAADAIFRGHVKEIYFFVAPLFVGGKHAVSSVGGDGISRLAEAVRVRDWNTERVGDDLLFHGFL